MKRTISIISICFMILNSICAQDCSLAEKLVQLQSGKEQDDGGLSTSIDFMKNSFPGLSDSIWEDVARNACNENIFNNVLTVKYCNNLNKNEIANLITRYEKGETVDTLPDKINKLLYSAYVVSQASYRELIEKYLKEKCYISKQLSLNHES